jgi:hypothetical protein
VVSGSVAYGRTDQHCGKCKLPEKKKRLHAENNNAGASIINEKPGIRLELTTYGLRNRCSTD